MPHWTDLTWRATWAYYYKVDEARAMKGPILWHRAEAATVTVTNTVCAPGGSTSLENSPTISTPETTLVTQISEPSPVPTAGQPSVSPGPNSGTSVGPTSGEPTSAEAPTTSLNGQTTTLQTSSYVSGSPTSGSSTSGSSSSADSSNAPTAASNSPTSTAAPTINAGFTQGGTNSLALALVLTFVRLFGV
ncbi:hypothetical protein BDW62DRAFT_200687 [Aspergillus aurantiobrunneus]